MSSDTFRDYDTPHTKTKQNLDSASPMHQDSQIASREAALQSSLTSTIDDTGDTCMHPSPTESKHLFREVVRSYLRRTFADDLDCIAANGGLEKLIRCAATNDVKGLAASEELSLASVIDMQAKTFGANELPKTATTPMWRLVWDASSDPMLRILVFAAVLSLILGLSFGERNVADWIDGVAIICTVAIVILVTAINDYVKEKNFAILYASSEKHVSVIRDGEKLQIPEESLVVGDLIYLEAGDNVPADSIVIKSYSLQADESSMTGESKAVHKDSYGNCVASLTKAREQHLPPTVANREHLISSPILLSGTQISTGSCTAIALAVGKESQTGQLLSMLTIESELTPLQNKLNALAAAIGNVGILAALLVFAVLAIQYIFEVTSQSESPSSVDVIQSIIGYMVTAITIVVLAVPEGLPLAVTISLAFSVQRMLSDNNYVRRMAACETMGGATVICSDKTGTLTRNRMEVDFLWNGTCLHTNISQDAAIRFDRQEVHLTNACITDSTNAAAPEVNYKPVDTLAHTEADVILVHGIAINSTATIVRETMDVNGVETEVIQQVGNPTECALLMFADKCGYDTCKIRRMYEQTEPVDMKILDPNNLSEISNVQILHQIPFSSERKMMTSIVAHPSDPSKVRIFVKGASEVIINRCSMLYTPGGLVPNTAEELSFLNDHVIALMSRSALRPITLAYVDVDGPFEESWVETHDPDEPRFLAIEKGFTCLAIAGVKDPLRPEVRDSILDCKIAGISVKMCTGDNIETAKQIGLNAGIYNPENGGIALVGSEFMRFVGGVVCSECHTEVCPCQTQSSETDAEIKILDEDTPPATGCCRRMIKRMTEPKKVRVDVLLNQRAFERIADKLEIVARSQPADKYALVTGLRNMGHVVAVTGDGTNDAPALKKADVGFAMGITGKEVAKQASDIVLMDDNFKSIVNAVRWGRNIYYNIQKFLQFQLTINASAVTCAIICSVAFRDSPLTPTQILWMNLVMDTLGALALATDSPTDALLHQPPYRKDDYLINQYMWLNILSQAIYQIIVVLTITFSGDCWIPEQGFSFDIAKWPDYSPFSRACGNGSTVASGRPHFPFSFTVDYLKVWAQNITPSRHFTMVFNAFFMMQVFNFVNARRVKLDDQRNIYKEFLTNKFSAFIILAIFISQIIIVQFGSYVFGVHTHGLTFVQWVICLAFGVGTIIIGFLTSLANERCLSWFPKSGQREINIETEPVPFALMSRARISQRRMHKH